MSREKQIEEMAKHCPCYFGEKCCIDYELPEKCDMLCQFGTYAEALYNAGYRKQSEGEWNLEHETYGRTLCSNCGEEALQEYSWNDVLKGHLKCVWSNFCPNCGAKMKGGAE